MTKNFGQNRRPGGDSNLAPFEKDRALYTRTCSVTTTENKTDWTVEKLEFDSRKRRKILFSYCHNVHGGSVGQVASNPVGNRDSFPGCEVAGA
jgi:hypothetical protein